MDDTDQKEKAPPTPDMKSAEIEQEKQAKTQRENQQIILYIFVSGVVASSWILGYMEFSFLWSFILIVLTFLVWWGKVMTLTEEHLKYHETLLHRKRALRHSETTEWLNFIINRWWVFSSSSIQDLIKKNLDPVLSQVRPAFIENIEVSAFSLGETTPFIKYMKVYECGEWRTGGRKALTWLTVGQPPPGLAQSQQYQIVLEADVALHCDEFKMVFTTRLGGKWMGMDLDVAVEKLNISGKMQLILHLNMDTPFPHIATVTVSFQEKPEVWFAIRLLKTVQMMEIPLLKSWIHSLVMDGLTEALVDPGKVDIRTASAGPTYAPGRNKAKTKAQGLLTVTLSSEHSKGSVFTEDLRYCVLRLADTDQKQTIGQTQGPGAWQDSCSFLIENLTKDKLIIKSKSKCLLSTYTLAQFELNLADYPILQKPIVETTVEEKVSKWAVSGSVKLDVALEYTVLHSIEEELDKEADKPCLPVQGQVAGVMYVCVHSADNLLALDRTGTSDPYCIIFSNGKKLKTTHYVCRTRNPKWDVHVEFIVGDFTKTMLSFLVYDWEGRHASEDDFLGSAYMVLSEDEPRMIRKNLTLGYNLLNVGQVDNMKLGTITVTAIYRPVASVAKSGTLHTPEMSSVAQNISFQEHQAVNKNKNFMTSALFVHTGLQWGKKLKLTGSKDQKGVGDLLSLGHGILELNILRARDLVPMDSNGFSDPFCEVRIGSERKFTTSIKKKTLNPVWDEWVTMQLPKTSETLEIIVWDRDPFFQKDFLGLVSLSLEELKKKSAEPSNAQWFTLQRIRSGSIQLHFKVITADSGSTSGSQEEYEGTSPMSASDSIDSGVARSVSGSPVGDGSRPLTPRLPASRSASGSQTQMSPILETPRVAPDVTQHCARASSSAALPAEVGGSPTSEEELSEKVGLSTSLLPPPKNLRPRGRSHSMRSLLPCVTQPSSPSLQQQQQSPPSPPPPSSPLLRPPTSPAAAAAAASSSSSRASPAASRRRRHRSASSSSSTGSRLLRRAVSDVNIKSNSPKNVFKTISQGSTPTIGKGALRRMDSVSSWGESIDAQLDVPAPSTEKYFGVSGYIHRARGLGGQFKQVYFKVRLDTRSAAARSQKHSYGKVLSRTGLLEVATDGEVPVNLAFDVDRGRGVSKDVLLIFNIKTSSRDHAAIKGFTLQELLTDSSNFQRWLNIGSGLEVELELGAGQPSSGSQNLNVKTGLLQRMRTSSWKKGKKH